jgi:hypothetical protein
MNIGNIKHLIAACLVCGALGIVATACQNGDWDEPSFSNGAPFGNNDITEEGLITIEELISRYPNVFESTDRNVQITENIKIKGRVTGNDLGGNIYKQFFIQDDTRALCIAVNQNGLNGYLAEGQEVLIDLKGLYIGGYRQMPELGQPYNGNSIGRMSKDVWASHFKLLGEPDASVVKPVEFMDIYADKDNGCGKLVVMTGVTFINANGKTAFAAKNAPTSGGNYVNQNATYGGRNVIVRTSTYADFAAQVLPYDTIAKRAVKCNITGIAARFGNDWQILIRKPADIHCEQ